MTDTTTIGIDLAKNTFSLVGINDRGKIQFRKTLSRKKLPVFIAQHPQCKIAMEACSGAHYWARLFQSMGHEAVIIAAKFITPFRKGAKNDNNDAEAICEASMRPNIWYVPIKTPDQQAVMCIHRARQVVVKDRTILINQLRGLLSEFGITISTGKYALFNNIKAILEDAENGLPMVAREILDNIWQRIKLSHEQILHYDRMLSAQVRSDKGAQRLMTIPGVGEQVSTAIRANVPNPKLFKNARQFAAWLGLVPKQYSTGGKIVLGRITKQGDKYMRMCLIHGARAVVSNIKDKQDKVSCWIRELLARRGYLKTVVAVAARNARTIWTLMIKQEDYRCYSNNVPENA